MALETSTRGEAKEAASGYFVALSAGGPGDGGVLYDGLYDAIDAESRRKADAKGELAAYVETFEADGYTRIGTTDDEIECDREKCLVKLTGRVLSSAGDDDSLALSLTEALKIKAGKPEVRGEGDQQERTYVLGKRPGSHVACTQKGFGKVAAFRCEFALDQGIETPANASVDAGGRGKLVSCALSPGTVKTAREASKEVDGGGLLRLQSGAGTGTKSVGFLRYVRQGKSVEFLDLFLCGDVSHDYFHIEGAARDPKHWITRPSGVGSSIPDLESLSQDEAKMQASATVVEDSPALLTVEVKFHLDKEASGVNEVYGADAFYVKLDKEWLR